MKQQYCRMSTEWAPRQPPLTHHHLPHHQHLPHKSPTPLPIPPLPNPAITTYPPRPTPPPSTHPTPRDKVVHECMISHGLRHIANTFGRKKFKRM